MRLFIAINFNDALTNALIDVQDQIWDAGVDGNYTPEENLHLTLAFIGEYGDPERVNDAMQSVSFTPFALSLEGVGAFEGLWWAGLHDSEELNAYARRLRRVLADADVPFDRKRFSPHITLIRRPSKPGLPEINVPKASMTVRRVSLMRSDRGRNGLIYTEIGGVDAISI